MIEKISEKIKRLRQKFLRHCNRFEVRGGLEGDRAGSRLNHLSEKKYEGQIHNSQEQQEIRVHQRWYEKSIQNPFLFESISQYISFLYVQVWSLVNQNDLCIEVVF